MEYHLWWDKKILKFLKLPPTPFLKIPPPQKKSLFKLFLPRYRHQRPLPLFFKKREIDKKEKIKKSRPKKKKIFSAIIKRKKYNTQKGCFKILLKCKHPIFPPTIPPRSPFWTPLSAYELLPRKTNTPYATAPYPPNYEVSRKDYHQCNSRHFMNIKYTFLFSPWWYDINDNDTCERKH